MVVRIVFHLALGVQSPFAPYLASLGYLNISPHSQTLRETSSSITSSAILLKRKLDASESPAAQDDKEEPDEPESLLFYTSSEKAELEGTSVEQFLNDDALIRQFRTRILPILSSAMDAVPLFAQSLQTWSLISGTPNIEDKKTPKDIISIDCFKRVCHAIMSRGFYFSNRRKGGGIGGAIMEENEEEEEAVLYLVPLADTFNHSSVGNHTVLNLGIKPKDDHPPTSATNIPTGPFFFMAAERPIEKGAQVFNTYGTLSNIQLLQSYGFIETAEDDKTKTNSTPSNPNDAILLPVSIVEEAIQQHLEMESLLESGETNLSLLASASPKLATYSQDSKGKSKQHTTHHNHTLYERAAHLLRIHGYLPASGGFFTINPHALTDEDRLLTCLQVLGCMEEEEFEVYEEEPRLLGFDFLVGMDDEDEERAEWSIGPTSSSSSSPRHSPSTPKKSQSSPPDRKGKQPAQSSEVPAFSSFSNGYNSEDDDEDENDTTNAPHLETVLLLLLRIIEKRSTMFPTTLKYDLHLLDRLRDWKKGNDKNEHTASLSCGSMSGKRRKTTEKSVTPKGIDIDADATAGDVDLESWYTPRKETALRFRIAEKKALRAMKVQVLSLLESL
ncbi:hypothetical protein HK102_001433 [Quaeritorhiza haematococci]|nr:hypothetical protein HK102_001433 [Quaeritorhiza haematococci]